MLLKENVQSRLHQNWKDIYKNIHGMASAFVADIFMKRFDSELFQLWFAVRDELVSPPAKKATLGGRNFRHIDKFSTEYTTA